MKRLIQIIKCLLKGHSGPDLGFNLCLGENLIMIGSCGKCQKELWRVSAKGKFVLDLD